MIDAMRCGMIAPHCLIRGKSMNIVALIIGALMLGSIYSIVGMGYCLIYKSTGFMNLAQGDFLMIGAYFGVTFFKILGLPYPVAILLTAFAMFLLGMSIQRGVIVQLLKRGSSFAYIILCTSAISMFLQNGALLVWGPKEIKFPSLFKSPFVTFLGGQVAPEALLVLGLACVSVVALYTFMNKTKFGIAMRAEAMDSMAASSMGINVPLVRGVAWGLSAALCGMIGVGLGPIYGVFLTMGGLYTQKGYAGAILGGYGNIYGALIGGMFYGFMETFVSAFITSTYKDLVSFAVLILCLTFMPTGLFKEPIIE